MKRHADDPMNPLIDYCREIAEELLRDADGGTLDPIPADDPIVLAFFGPNYLEGGLDVRN